MNFSAVIVAAGASTRAGPGAPKPWRELGGRPILAWSIEALSAAGAREIVVVVAADRVAGVVLEGATVVAGGSTRAESVQAGLSALTTDRGAAVLVHDAARPFLKRA